MKPRPRYVENHVAMFLNTMYPQLSEVKRQPIIGRTGPDITTNELGFVIDVKSRLQCPKGYFVDGFTRIGDHFLMPLEKSNQACAYTNSKEAPSVTVERWLSHMDAWREENMADGISMLVLHRPKKPIGKSIVVIYFDLLGEYLWRISNCIKRPKTENCQQRFSD